MKRAPRVKRLHVMIASTALVTAAAATPVLLADDEPTVTPAPDFVLSDHTPVSDDEGIEYEQVEIPGTDDIVSSIGSGVENLVVTTVYDLRDAVVNIFDEAANLLGIYESVRGIALSDPGGTLTAWLEVKETPAESTSTVVAVDSSTGQELGRLSVTDRTTVMAVHDDTVAISDGDTSHLWTVGGSSQPIAYVPDDYYVVGLTETRVVASDLNGVTVLYDRDGGSTVATLNDLTSWDTNVTGDLLAGATSTGNALLVNLLDGATSLLNPTVDAGTASFGEDNTVVVTSVSALSQAVPEDVVSVCSEGQACEDVLTDGVPYLPNEALGQLVSQAD